LPVGGPRDQTARTLPDDVRRTAVDADREPATGDTAPDHSRSGDDIAEAIEVAERGSSVQGVHDRGAGNRSGEAPVERTAGDPEMTEGQVVLGEEGTASAPPDPAPAPPSSGAAQSQQGARASDRLSGQPSGD
jgi:hypothetical protein